jgi:two-component sensor histidine kinase
MNGTAALEGVFITGELARRPERPPDYKREKDALRELLAQMASAPELVLPRFVALAMELTGGSSAGISILEHEPSPGVFRWRYLHGGLAPFENATTPRDDSPCGVTLDRRAPVLARHPEEAYSWIAEFDLVIPEVLLVPIYVGTERAFGTLWIVADEAEHFRQEDARLSVDLAEFIGTALRMLEAEAELREALREQELMAREMSHRVKNVFALVQSMVRLSAKGTDSAEVLAEALSGRLIAMAAAHGLVRREQVSGELVTLDSIFAAILKPYAAKGSAESRRITLVGPSVQCGETAASGLALILHELATNAAKYGALASEEGQLEIEWKLKEESLQVMWRETGCALVGEQPPSIGFGTNLIDRTTKVQFGGTFERLWLAEGVACTISVPRQKLDG